MKIVQIMTVMEAGGMQRVAYLLSEALKERGHETGLWFLYKKRPAYDHVPEAKSFLDHKPGATEVLPLLFKVRKEISSARPDVVISHTYYANVLGQMAAMMSGVGSRIAVHHNPAESFPAVARLMDKVCGTLPVYGTNVAVSDAVVSSMNAYPKTYRGKLRRIYNGIPFPAKNPSTTATRLRFALPTDRPLLLNVGRLADQKNQMALFPLLAELPEAHLALVGDGELRSELKQKASARRMSDRVHFLGEIPNDQVHDVMACADLFLFPSNYEAMPIVLLEAMSLGLPIVASDIPGNREVLGGAGMIADFSSPECVVAIREILADAQSSAKLGTRAKERATDFQLETMVSGYERLFANS
jgi:glycosyltransferase involved in cell wall biosynthesis